MVIFFHFSSESHRAILTLLLGTRLALFRRLYFFFLCVKFAFKLTVSNAVGIRMVGCIGNCFLSVIFIAKQNIKVSDCGVRIFAVGFRDFLDMAKITEELLNLVFSSVHFDIVNRDIASRIHIPLPVYLLLFTFDVC